MRLLDVRGGLFRDIVIKGVVLKSHNGKSNMLILLSPYILAISNTQAVCQQ